MSTSRLRPHHVFGVAVLLGIVSVGATPADTPVASSSGANDLPPSLPQDGLFSSIKQSLKESELDVVRGHFDLGTPPNSHRYYCLVNPKSGALEPNGVLGDPVRRSDGMTGIKQSAVSLYRCAKAEEAGILTTDGYVLIGRAALGVARAHAQAPVPSPAPAAAAPPAPAVSAPAASVAAGSAAAPPAAIASPAGTTPAVAAAGGSAAAAASAASAAPPPSSVSTMDVSGVKLGMSLEQARSTLKSKKLPQYKEWTENLSYNDANNTSHPLDQGRFVNVIAAWNPPATGLESSGETFEVMFTPDPGKERVLAIVHSVGYPQARAIHETALEEGLVRKYGGYAAAGDLPQSPTWRMQSGGAVEVGDACNRRGLFGGLGEPGVLDGARENVALRKSLDELRYQMEHCGSAIVTEDHFTVNGGALPAERLVTRYSVTAYSPVLAYEGARAASRLIEAGAREAGKAAGKSRSEPAPDL